MTRVYPVIPDCEVSEATGVGMVLLIPVVTPGSGPFPLFHMENIGVIRENTSLKYIMAHDTAISRDGAVYAVPLVGCKQRGAITICPHPLRRSETAEYGFNCTQGCTLEIEPTGPHFTRAGYGGRGQYCVSTLETSFWFNGLQCPIPQHEFWFTPRCPVTIGQAHISEVRRREPESIQSADEFRNTLREYQEPEQAPTPHLAEVLRELRTRVGHSVKLYHQLQAHIKDLEEDAEMALQTQGWAQRVWNWGLNVNIHLWVRIISHVIVGVQLLLALAWLLVACHSCRQHKTRKARKAMLHAINSWRVIRYYELTGLELM
ncbi:uncharacterized protein [Chiloscyllium punctatum]|uniref:uncharacterized protein n=1 Tax=Chiloscyllium punctatum TaxID=137246 RepID=UPI003B636AA5